MVYPETLNAPEPICANGTDGAAFKLDNENAPCTRATPRKRASLRFKNYSCASRFGAKIPQQIIRRSAAAPPLRGMPHSLLKRLDPFLRLTDQRYSQRPSDFPLGHAVDTSKINTRWHFERRLLDQLLHRLVRQRLRVGGDIAVHTPHRLSQAQLARAVLT